MFGHVSDTVRSGWKAGHSTHLRGCAGEGHPKYWRATRPALHCCYKMFPDVGRSNPLCLFGCFPGNPPSKPIKKTLKQRFLKLLPCYRSGSSSSSDQSKCQHPHVHHHHPPISISTLQPERYETFITLSFLLLFLPLWLFPQSIPAWRKCSGWSRAVDGVLQTRGPRPTHWADQLQQKRAAGPLPGVQKRQSKTSETFFSSHSILWSGLGSTETLYLHVNVCVFFPTGVSQRCGKRGDF